MQSLTLYISLSLVELFAFTVEKAEACSCFRRPPQTQFCEDDFVALVKVKNVSVRYETEISYNIVVKKVFKGKLGAYFNVRDNLWTNSTYVQCGVDPTLGMTYVVSGQFISEKLYTSTCNFWMPSNKVTRLQINGFKKVYKTGCKCRFTHDPNLLVATKSEKSGRNLCLWEPTIDAQICQEKYGICQLGNDGCSWRLSALYKNCIKQN